MCIFTADKLKINAELSTVISWVISSVDTVVQQGAVVSFTTNIWHVQFLSLQIYYSWFINVWHYTYVHICLYHDCLFLVSFITITKFGAVQMNEMPGVSSGCWSHCGSSWMRYLFTQLWLLLTGILERETLQQYVRLHRPPQHSKAAVSHTRNCGSWKFFSVLDNTN